MNIRVLREAGGIGDIVRIIPVLRGLRETYPSATIWVFAPGEYEPLLAGWYDRFVPVPRAKRRPRDAGIDEKRWPYLAVPSVEFGLTVDLYCPAFRHERQQRGDVWLDRIELMCMAAGVEPSSMTPRINLSPGAEEAARRWIARWSPGPGALVAVQPFSTDPARNWPLRNWLRLADALEREGRRVLILDACEGRTRPFRQLRVLGKPLDFVAALIAQCDLVVGPDSGLLHVAAAVGTPGVGLFASQSPGVTYRYYPRHAYVYPPWDGQRRCRWPCHWARPPECCRRELEKRGRTCAMLARIGVDDVLRAVRGCLAASGAAPHAPVALHAMPDGVRRRLARCPVVEGLPLPYRDFALDRLALVRGVDDLAPVLREAYRVLKPGGTLFIASPEVPLPLDMKKGFAVIAAPASGLEIWKKKGTWPYDGCA